MTIASLLIISLLLLANTGYANGQDDPPVAAEQVIHERLCHGMGVCPFDAPALREPRHAKFLISCRHWTEKADLQRAYGRSDALTSLNNLDDAGLLQHAGTRVRSRYPILIGRDRDDYFDLLRPAARKAEVRYRRRLKWLLAAVARRGWTQWAYHYAWSGVFDSQFIWAAMVEARLVPPLSPEIVWVVFPQHPNKSGTNYYPDDRIPKTFLMVTWVPGPAEHPATINSIGRNWRTIYGTALAEKAATGEDSALLSKLGLLGADGKIRIPVIRATDPLYLGLQTAASEYLTIVRRDLPAALIARRFQIDERTAFAMAYHDFSWEVLQIAIDRKLLRRPAALSNNADGGAVGAESLIDAYPPFIELVRKALGEI